MAKDKAMKLEKNNRKNLLFIALVIFLIVIITGASCFGIIAWARYRTVTNASAEAGVAKWSFKVNGSSEEIANIDLGETISYEHVAEKRIAPGTSGAFDLVIDGSGSQVSIEYYIDIDLAQKSTNMKFYLDSSFSNELVITTDKKIRLEDEILLENINTLVTKTIYWKWEYRTIEMPTDEVLAKYGIDKTNLLTQYNNAITDEEKEEVLKKVNDKIDTQEAGRTVVLPIKVTGIQKNIAGFEAKSAYITSSTTKNYSEGDEVTLALEFTEGVYGDSLKGAITESTAPVIKLKFEELTTGSNPIAVVASTVDAKLRIATETERTAIFVSVDTTKINYKYTIQSGDKGIIKIASVTGNVYSKDGTQINLGEETIEIEKPIQVVDIEPIGNRLVDVVNIGDYVNYDAGTYSISETGYAGATLSGELSTNEVTKWRVLSKDITTGVVELMAEEPTSTTLTLSGMDGYKNAEEALNKVCEIYRNGEGATGARSINEKDVMQYSDFDPKTQYSNSYSSTGTVGGTRTYTSGTFIKGETYNDNGTIREVVIGGVDQGDGIVTASSGNPVTVIQTFYYISNETTTKQGYISRDVVNGEKIYKMLFKSTIDETDNKEIYWMNMKCALLYSAGCGFYVQTVYNGYIDTFYLYYSPGSSKSYSHTCMPVVILKPNIQTLGQDSNGVWNLK